MELHQLAKIKIMAIPPVPLTAEPIKFSRNIQISVNFYTLKSCLILTIPCLKCSSSDHHYDFIMWVNAKLNQSKVNFHEIYKDGNFPTCTNLILKLDCCFFPGQTHQHVDGLVQDCSRSIANILDIHVLQSCTKTFVVYVMVWKYMYMYTKQWGGLNHWHQGNVVVILNMYSRNIYVND